MAGGSRRGGGGGGGGGGDSGGGGGRSGGGGGGRLGSASGVAGTRGGGPDEPNAQQAAALMAEVSEAKAAGASEAVLSALSCTTPAAPAPRETVAGVVRLLSPAWRILPCAAATWLNGLATSGGGGPAAADACAAIIAAGAVERLAALCGRAAEPPAAYLAATLAATLATGGAAAALSSTLERAEELEALADALAAQTGHTMPDVSGAAGKALAAIRAAAAQAAGDDDLPSLESGSDEDDEEDDEEEEDEDDDDDDDDEDEEDEDDDDEDEEDEDDEEEEEEAEGGVDTAALTPRIVDLVAGDVAELVSQLSHADLAAAAARRLYNLAVLDTVYDPHQLIVAAGALRPLPALLGRAAPAAAAAEAANLAHALVQDSLPLQERMTASGLLDALLSQMAHADGNAALAAAAAVRSFARGAGRQPLWAPKALKALVVALGSGGNALPCVAAEALWNLAVAGGSQGGGSQGADQLAAAKNLLHAAARLMANSRSAPDAARQAAALVGSLAVNGREATRERVLATAGCVEGLLSQLATPFECHPHPPSSALVALSKCGAAACERLVAAPGCGAALVAALVAAGKSDGRGSSSSYCNAATAAEIVQRCARRGVRGRITAAEPGLLGALAALLHTEKAESQEALGGACCAASVLGTLSAAGFEESDAVSRAPGCLTGLVRLVSGALREPVDNGIALFLPAASALKALAAAGASICERVFRTPGCLEALTARLDPYKNGAAAFMAVDVLQELATGTGGCCRRAAAAARDRRRAEIAGNDAAVASLRQLAATGDAMVADNARGLLESLGV
jgi:hypothetical protein